jgi:hypothetical protein
MYVCMYVGWKDRRYDGCIDGIDFVSCFHVCMLAGTFTCID